MLKESSRIFRGWTLFLCGICMGAADLVPGISGGTIAFILGFYTPLVNSLKTLNRPAFYSLIRGDWKAFSEQVAWKFLLTLLAGMGCAFMSLASFFHDVLEHEVYRVYLYATFLGLVLASFVFCLRQVQGWSWKLGLGLGISALMAYELTGLTGISPVKGEYAIEVKGQWDTIALSNYDEQTHLLKNLSLQDLSVLLAQGVVQQNHAVFNSQHLFLGLIEDFEIPHQPFLLDGWLILCGALAICALLLPGISGSYILTLLGVYPLVMESLADFLHDLRHLAFNSEAFAVLFSLGVGIGLGAFAFAHFLSWLLRHYSNQTLALLSGCMIGSLRAVWPFWTFEYALIPAKLAKGPQLVPLDPFLPSYSDPLVWQAILCAVGGFILVFVLETYVRSHPELANKRLDEEKDHELEQSYRLESEIVIAE